MWMYLKASSHMCNLTRYIKDLCGMSRMHKVITYVLLILLHNYFQIFDASSLIYDNCTCPYTIIQIMIMKHIFFTNPKMISHYFMKNQIKYIIQTCCRYQIFH